MYEFERHGQEDGEEQYFQQTVTLDNWTIFLGDKRSVQHSTRRRVTDVNVDETYSETTRLTDYSSRSK